MLPESGMNLGSPGSGRRGGPRHRYTLDLTELDCVESWAVAQSSSGAQTDIFKRGTVEHCAGTSCAAASPKREEHGRDLLQLSAPHRWIKGVKSKWLVSTSLTQIVQSGESELPRVEVVSWKLDNCDYYSPD